MTNKEQFFRRATFGQMEKLLTNALHDLLILSGDIPGPSGVSWQDVAGAAQANLYALSRQLESAREGNHEAIISFPSPTECLENAK